MDDKEAHKIHSEIEDAASKVDAGGRRLSTFNLEGEGGKCFSCERAWIYRTARRNDPVVMCRAAFNDPLLMPHDITECSVYSKRGEVDIFELIKMHNPIDLSKSDKVMGFKREASQTTDVPRVPTGDSE